MYDLSLEEFENHLSRAFLARLRSERVKGNEYVLDDDGPVAILSSPARKNWQE